MMEDLLDLNDTMQHQSGSPSSSLVGYIEAEEGFDVNSFGNEWEFIDVTPQSGSGMFPMKEIPGVGVKLETPEQ